MKLVSLYEDKDLTPGGSKEFSAKTEKEVYPVHKSAGPGVKPPPAGDVSKMVDASSPAYATDTIAPSRIHIKQKPKVGKI